MKATVTRPDGTKVDLEGESVEVLAALAQLAPVPLQLTTTPSIFPPAVAPYPVIYGDSDSSRPGSVLVGVGG